MHETADGAPHPVISDEDASVIAPPFAQPTPVHGEAEAAPAPEPAAESAPVAEAPRRRSTVREPAPIVTSEEVMLPPPAPAPVETQAPTPVVSSTGEEPATPKRGWWGRRLLGDKG